jgi:hypothetical protein
MHHLIFEGAELTGKSWLMSQVYDHLEPKYNQNHKILDGCHWFNCDVGVYGSDHGQKVIEHYCQIFQELEGRNLLVEKLHLSDLVYNRLLRKIEIDYYDLEKKLQDLNFKIILPIFPEDEALIKKRIADRIRLYPHYERILHQPGWYIMQQREFLKEIKKSLLPALVIEVGQLPDDNLTRKILDWIGEK